MKETFRERCARLVNNDPVTIADQYNFRAKWGSFPCGSKAMPKPSPKKISKLVKTVLVKHGDKMMLAENEFHKGESVWRYEVGIWACVKADKCLKFLLKKDVATAKLELTRRGFNWQWQ